MGPNPLHLPVALDRRHAAGLEILGPQLAAGFETLGPSLEKASKLPSLRVATAGDAKRKQSPPRATARQACQIPLPLLRNILPEA